MQKVLINAAQASKLASSWVQRNQGVATDLAKERDKLLFDLGRATNSATYSAQNIQHRPTIALFGASQAGKSYLVSTIAAGPDGALTTHWDNNEINFMTHVNPSGGNSEATGFATRFSHQTSHAPHGFPVELRLLSESEVAMILINSYFNDISQGKVTVSSDENFYLNHFEKLSSFIDRKAQEQALAAPKSLAVVHDEENGDYLDFSDVRQRGLMVRRTVKSGEVEEQNYWQSEQVVELADYVGNNSQGKIGSFERMPKVWLKFREILPFMTLEGRVKALSIFWGELPIFSETYRTLAQELLKVKGNKVVYAPKEAFVQELSDKQLRQNEGGTILHITRLGQMFSDDKELTCALAKPLPLLGNSEDLSVESQVSLNYSRLAALAVELRFSLEGEVELGDFDVLDLPGARSRDVINYDDVVNDGKPFIESGKWTQEMGNRGSEFFRRGKVDYIFDSYARRNEIDQLLFCIGVNNQQDVTVVMDVLNKWVENSVGSTPQKRHKRYNPLTIVLTRFDEAFDRQVNNIKNNLPIDMEQETNIALNRIEKAGWFTEWVPNTPFTQVFLARKPNLGDIVSWIDFEKDSKKELGIRQDYAAAIDEVKLKFAANDKFKRYVSDIEGKLDALLSLNDGGVSKIIEAIKNNAQDEKIRIENRALKAKQLIGACKSILDPFATKEAAQALNKASKEANDLALGLLQCNSLCPCFDLIRNLLEFDYSALERIYDQGFSAGSNVYRFVNDVREEYLDKLYDLNRKDHNDLIAITNLIVQSYLKKQRNIAADPNGKVNYSICFKEGTNELKSAEELKDSVLNLLITFFREVATTFRSSQLGIDKYMVQVLLEHENTNKNIKNILPVQTRLMSYILSDFSMYLGANLIEANGTKKAEVKEEVVAAPQNEAPSQAAPASSSDDQMDFSDFSADDFGDLLGDYAPAAAPEAKQNTKAASAPVRKIEASTTAMAIAEQGGVLGTNQGPVNHYRCEHGVVSYDESLQDHEVFAREVKADDSKLLPLLDKNTANYEFKFVSDYVSTLRYMMCNVNILAESKYSFSADENRLLCQILATMENFEKWQK